MAIFPSDDTELESGLDLRRSRLHLQDKTKEAGGFVGEKAVQAKDKVSDVAVQAKDSVEDAFSSGAHNAKHQAEHAKRQAEEKRQHEELEKRRRKKKKAFGLF